MQQTTGEQLADYYAQLGEMGLETQQQAVGKRLAALGLNEKGKPVSESKRQDGALTPEQQVKAEPAGEAAERRAASTARSEPPAARRTPGERSDKG